MITEHEIPDHILIAARQLYRWFRKHPRPETVVLNGVRLDRPPNLLTIQVDPENYSLVPLEPTQEMIEAALLKFARENGGLEASVREIFKAMVEASPCRHPNLPKSLHFFGRDFIEPKVK